MALELYMVGVMVKDMAKAVEFYQRLGLAIPAGSAERQFVEVKMGNDLTFFLNARPDPHRAEPAGGYRILLEFNLKSREAVTAKYNEMVEAGYQSYRTPFDTPFGAYFAFINDPDDNTILLSA